MKQIQKRVLLTLSSFLVAGLILAGVVVALAATSFTLVGTLNYVGTTYSVDSQVITVTATTVCTDLNGASVLGNCSGLATKKVQATGIVSGTVYTATNISELGTFVGVITKIDTTVTPNLWTVGSMVFAVNADTTLNGTFAEGDVAEVTYKKVGTDNVAVVVDPVELFTFTGEVTVIGATQWTVGGQPFEVDPNALIYAGAKEHDIVTVTYYKLEASNVAVKIELFAPFKNENSRCENRPADFPIPKGIEVKLGEDFNEDQVRAMFCQGFGWGEIVQAFKWANDDLTPAELLAMKAGGMGWGQIKKAASTSQSTGDLESGQIVNSNLGTQNGHGKPNNPGNSDHSKQNPGNGKGKNK